MRPNFVAAVAILATGSAFAATPGPDPRVEQALNTGPIASLQRSVDFQKTLPQPEKRERSAAQGEGVRVAEDVYVDPALAPARRGPDEPAIRVYRRDRR